MKTTVVIQIGNSDNKLSQFDWSKFVRKTFSLINKRADMIHFTGFSTPDAPRQNACWVFTIDSNESHLLWDNMKQLRIEFKQDSSAWTEGITVFLDD